MDRVVGGFTHTEDGLAVSSLLLGLFDETDSLRYVGGTRLTQAESKRGTFARGATPMRHGKYLSCSAPIRP